MKYCPFCGAGLQETMVFCPKCGKRFLDGFENPEAVEPEKLDLNHINLVEPAPTPEIAPESAFETEEPVAVPVPEPRAVEEAVTVLEAEPVVAEEPKRPAKKKTKKTVWFVVAVILLVLGVGGFFGIREAIKTASITDAANSVLYLEVFDDAKNLVATASGFVVDDGTTLITNYHVIEGAYHIVAWTPDGEKSVDISKILTYDRDADLAVLKCDSNIGVRPLVLGDSDSVKQGDSIYAVGYPLGLAHTLSDGIVSSRYIDNLGVDILQITAAISSGSSGGALFNENGKVIGVICASYVDGQNLNLAIASNELIECLNTTENPIELKDFYYTTKETLGTSLLNFMGGGYAVENDQFSFWIEMNRIIVQHDKTENIAENKIAVGASGLHNLNIYKGRLYWTEQETGVWSCEIGESFDKKGSKELHKLLLPNGEISKMMITNDTCFCICYADKNFSFYAIDLSSGEVLSRDTTVLTFVYDDQNIYYVKEGTTDLCVLDIETLAVREVEFSGYPRIQVKNLSGDGILYLAAGGYHGDASTNYLLEYDLTTNSYASIEVGNLWPGSILVFGDLALLDLTVAFGEGATAATYDEVFILDNGNWTPYYKLETIPSKYYFLSENQCLNYYWKEWKTFYP